MRIEFNKDGFRALLLSDETKALISGQVETIREKANANMGESASEGFNGKTVQGNYGGGRWMGFVGTSDLATMIAESEGKALTKAVSG